MRRSPDRQAVGSMFDQKRMSNDAPPHEDVAIRYRSDNVSIGVAEAPPSSNETVVMSLCA